MKLRVVISGLIAGIFPVRLTPIDQELVNGQVAKRDIKSGLFSGTVECSVVDAPSAQSVALVPHSGDETHTVLLTDRGDQVALSPAALWQLAGSAAKRVESLTT